MARTVTVSPLQCTPNHVAIGESCYPLRAVSFRRLKAGNLCSLLNAEWANTFHALSKEERDEWAEEEDDN